MTTPSGGDDAIARVCRAFEADGFHVSQDEIRRWKGGVGLIARHATATTYENGEPKRAYYVEGSPYEMGFLLGWMCEPDIAEMTETYIENFIRSMIPRLGTADENEEDNRLYDFFLKLVTGMIRSGKALADVPDAYIQEVEGLVEGCLEANAGSPVTAERIWALNVGFDCLLAHLYACKLPRLRRVRAARRLRAPMACNALAILNDAAADGALFGRDFMFPTAGVLQKTACLIVYRPKPAGEDGSLPFVSVTTPGFVGSIAAMNAHGVAGGVDVVRAGNCTPERIGVNSLLLVRDTIEHSETIDAAVDRIEVTPRGVTWLYPLAADGGDGPDRACIVEAGASMPEIDVCSYPRRLIRSLVPSRQFVSEHPTTRQRNGIMVRWDDYVEPTDYRPFNDGLWRRKPKRRYPDAFTRVGRIDRTHEEHNCPSSSYFAPLRARRNQVVICSNHYVIPEMRLCAMTQWINILESMCADNSQWRYDELNRRTLLALQDGPIDAETAKELIDFLAPNRVTGHPTYYEKSPKSPDGLETAIEGVISLFDLKRRTVESHYGYSCDDWIRIRLPAYVG